MRRDIDLNQREAAKVQAELAHMPCGIYLPVDLGLPVGLGLPVDLDLV